MPHPALGAGNAMANMMQGLAWQGSRLPTRLHNFCTKRSAWTPSDFIFQLHLQEQSGSEARIHWVRGRQKFPSAASRQGTASSSQSWCVSRGYIHLLVLGVQEKGVGAGREVFQSSGFGQNPEHTLPSHPSPSWNKWVLLGRS